MQKVSDLAQKCMDILRAGGKVILFVKGGGFGDAQHLHGNFIYRFLLDSPGPPSLALGTKISTMTAIDNDYGYENVFAMETEEIATPIDVLITLTNSGDSCSILKALESEKLNKVSSLVYTGAGRGKLPVGNDIIQIPYIESQKIQESQIPICHIIWGLFESTIFSSLRPQ